MICRWRTLQRCMLTSVRSLKLCLKKAYLLGKKAAEVMDELSHLHVILNEINDVLTNISSALPDADKCVIFLVLPKLD